MGNPIQIIESYVNVATGATSELSKERLKICHNNCEHLKNIMGVEVCSCGCPLIGLTSGTNNKCPHGKW